MRPSTCGFASWPATHAVRKRTSNLQVVEVPQRRQGADGEGRRILAATTPDPSTSGFVGGPPGTRTPNLRIKSLIRRCRSEPWKASELHIFVAVLPIVTRSFPLLHGDETGIRRAFALTFSIAGDRRRRKWLFGKHFGVRIALYPSGGVSA
jgi:hypothetical protein